MAFANEIYAMVNEGARILEGGFALRAADIDVIYLTGYGFPGFRGGAGSTFRAWDAARAAAAPAGA